MQQEQIWEWERTGKWPVWWIYPDGRTERIDLPLGPWMEGWSFNVMPTQKGLVYVTHKKRKGKDGLPIQGLYMPDENGFGKLLTGAVDMGASYNMSPDGCKIAFGYAPTDRATRYGPGTIRILDVCRD